MIMKNFLLFLCLFAGTVSAQTSEPETNYGLLVSLECSYSKPTNAGVNFPRTPIQPPTVYLNDHTLYICSDGRDFDLQVVTEDEAVVYSTYVSSSTTEVQLPTTLSGDYVLQMFNGDYVFTGEIEL